jgi:group I intron endonuclease
LLKQKKIRTNKVNGKSYIGSSVNLDRRFYIYYSQYNLNKHNMLIHRALLKYGYSNFKLEILEYCNRDSVRAREQYYLDNLAHEYNILPTAGSSLGQNHSESTKQKMSEAAQKAWQDQERREAGLAHLAKVQAAATAAGAAASSKAILVKNIETGETVCYVSQTQAAI